MRPNTSASPNIQARKDRRIIIVRDRPAAGGGICNYYESIKGYFESQICFSDVGQAFSFYGKANGLTRLINKCRTFRLCMDWLALALRLVTFRPKIVQLNPGMDYRTRKALRRDAVNLLIAKIFRRTVVVFWRGWLNDACGLPNFPTGHNSWLHRIYRKADVHIVLASRFKEDLIRWGFKSPIYLETTVASDDAIKRATTRRPKTARTGKRLLYLSRVEVAKGVYELVDAFRILKSADPEYSLTIVGDGPELAALKQYCADLKIENTRFLGYLTGDSKFEALDDADLFCFLSYTEGMPNAVLEAMAMGLPILSSDAGGLRDILADKKTGIVFEMDNKAPSKSRIDPEFVARRIAEFCSDAKTLARVSENNIKCAQNRFAAVSVADRLESIYDKILTQV